MGCDIANFLDQGDQDCECQRRIALIVCIVATPLLVLLVAFLLLVACCLGCKNRKLKRQLSEKNKAQQEKVLPLDNPTYNGLAMTDLEQETGQPEQGNYDEIKNDTDVPAMYDMVCSANLPTQPSGAGGGPGAAPDCIDAGLSNYDVIGEDENLKSSNRRGGDGAPGETQTMQSPPPSAQDLPEYSTVVSKAGPPRAGPVGGAGRVEERSYLNHPPAAAGEMAPVESYATVSCPANPLPPGSVESSRNRMQRSHDNLDRAGVAGVRDRAGVGGVRWSVDIAQLEQNDDVDVLYCNTAAPPTPHSYRQQQGEQQVPLDAIGVEQEQEMLYINVKH